MDDGLYRQIRRAEELFHEALERPIAERALFVHERCGDDEALKSEVLSLLEVHARSGDRMRTAACPALHDDADEEDLPLPAIPGYDIVRLIARGGMGSVYEAQQQQPRRRVALKLMRRSLISRSALRRFQYEAHALARLQHPNIAQVFEAGTFDTGQGIAPFFAMEFIEGQPITEYIQQRGLSCRDRVRPPRQLFDLFFQIIDAVQHAHQRGLIHRDLKPGNILVTSDGSAARVKVIDFGIARTIESSDVAITTLQTEIGQVLGTLQYMSPEQCDADPHEIDVRSDVYALGLILYELLYEQRPYDVSQTTIVRAASIIKSQAPVDPSSIDRRWHSDLETIVLKCLEKDRNRRYASADALRDDLQRYLNNEPIAARPPSLRYRALKFASRNRAAVSGAAAAVIALIATAIIATSFAVSEHNARLEAERQRRITEAFNEFVNNDLLAVADPYRSSDRELTVRAALDAASEKIDQRFADEPLVEAALRETLARTYWNLGAYASAEAHARRCLELRQRDRGPTDALTLDAMNLLGSVLQYAGRYAESEEIWTSLLELCRRHMPPNDPKTLLVQNNLAQSYMYQAKYEPAEAMLLEVLRIRRAESPEDPQTFVTMNALAMLYAEQGRLDEAVKLAEASVEGSRRVAGDEHPDTMTAINNLATYYSDQGRVDLAIPLLHDLLQARRRVLGPEHPLTLVTANNLGLAYIHTNQLEQAEPILRQTLELRHTTLGEDHPNTLTSINNLALACLKTQRFDEAVELYHQAVDGRMRVYGENHPATLTSLTSLGTTYMRMNRLDEALPLLEEATHRAWAHLPAGHLSIARISVRLGECQREMGAMEQAQETLLAAYASLEASLGPSHQYTMEAVQALAELYARWNKPDEEAKWRASIIDHSHMVAR